MRHFTKIDSPETFENWKTTQGRSARYDGIPSQIKKDLRESLSKEQSNLCCYCGVSLQEDNKHIEHFKPQSQFPGQALKYKNLHVSCMGKKHIISEVEELEFCGHEKGNWYDEDLLVSPLDPNCESYFLFNFNGSVIDNKNSAAKETIKKLNLDAYLLRCQREQAIEGFMEAIDLENPDVEEIEGLICSLDTPDENGYLDSFSYIITGLLKSLI